MKCQHSRHHTRHDTMFRWCPLASWASGKPYRPGISNHRGNFPKGGFQNFRGSWEPRNADSKCWNIWSFSRFSSCNFNQRFTTQHPVLFRMDLSSQTMLATGNDILRGWKGWLRQKQVVNIDTGLTYGQNISVSVACWEMQDRISSQAAVSTTTVTVINSLAPAVWPYCSA